jgi:hypothetical protein
MRIENFPKLKRCDHSPKRDEFIDVSSDPPYFSLDSPFKDKEKVFAASGRKPRPEDNLPISEEELLAEIEEMNSADYFIA